MEPSSSMAPPQGSTFSSEGSGFVGTPGYLAPEGSTNSTDKSDVYTASLILLELLCPRFETIMERQELLDNFRCKGSLPPHLSPRGKGMLAAFGRLLRQMSSDRPQD